MSRYLRETDKKPRREREERERDRYVIDIESPLEWDGALYFQAAPLSQRAARS